MSEPLVVVGNGMAATVDGLWYLDLIRSGADVLHWRDVLAFGPALALPQAA